MSLFYLALVLISLSISGHESNIIKGKPTYSLFAPRSTSSPSTTKTTAKPRPAKGQLDGKDHPCYRQCDGVSKTCYYHFTVEWYQSMSKACYDCPFNITDCRRKDCIPASGFSRTITVLNRKMPGPQIEVCLGDRIIVDLDNTLMASGTTIHWHGQHQKETPYMDGTPFITQCPIEADSTFRYDFKATQHGTHFYHSHIGLQRGDGMSGALIVRRPKDLEPCGCRYDHDNSEHVMFLADWVDQLSISLFTRHYHSDGGNSPSTLLINGAGSFNVTRGNRTASLEPARFEVQQGRRYRFRLVNAEFLNCPVELSVDGHNITVIASDGSDLEPVTATYLVTYAGERYDFVINADQQVGSYWIKARGLLACLGTGARQVGILQYKGSNGNPQGVVNWNKRPGLQVNAVNEGEEQNRTLTVSRLRSEQGYDESLKPVPDHKFYVAYDLYSKNNTNFNRPEYPQNAVRPEYQVFTPQLNHVSLRLPPSPLLVSRPSQDTFCNESTIPDRCKTDYCQCTQVLNVRLNAVVELVIIDEGSSFDANHPFHLHGYTFRVLGQRRMNTTTNRTTLAEVKSYDRSGGMTRNFRNPPIKDTVTVPDGGYTIIRFKADNPGYWLFHCHIEFHAEIGMALVFKVGEHKDMKPVPAGFPTCGDYPKDVRSNSQGAIMISRDGHPLNNQVSI